MLDLTTLFCTIDDFFLKFEPVYYQFLKQQKTCSRVRCASLNISEIVFIVIWYKCSHFTNFKAFFTSLNNHHRSLFQGIPCYERMIYLIKRHHLALHALHFYLMKGCEQPYLWIDSTSLPVCKNQRIQRHKALIQIATRGKSSMGWFFGCKLHVIMNASGHLVSTALSNGHTADIKMVEQLVSGFKAKLYADRGYISSKLKSQLRQQHIDLITYHRKNMQALQLDQDDEYHLKQRNKIETLFSLLKGSYHLVTSKARSLTGYLAGIYASLCAYQICHTNKPVIHVKTAIA